MQVTIDNDEWLKLTKHASLYVENRKLYNAAPELLALLIESQKYIGGDWRERRDAAVKKATGEDNA